MTTQRKIHHLLASEGEGASFAYLPKLSAPFDLAKPIIVTEKVDGSTMQALNGEPWKRYDRFSKGDPRKHTASEEERYKLVKCSPDNPAEAHYLRAFLDCVTGFRRVPSDTWVYFEALGSRIGARYKGLRPTVRVFDTASNGKFNDFGTTIGIAGDVGLPAVENFTTIFETLENLVGELSRASSGDAELSGYELEGWVLRQASENGEVVAKIRKGDLTKLRR